MTRVIPRKNNKFSGLFDDSDDEIEQQPDILEAQVNYNVQLKHNAAVQNYQMFVNNPDFITKTGDPTTNIVDMYTMFKDKMTTKTYCIPDNKISKFFKYIEVCRRTGCQMMIYEKQQQYSGIMLDFDVYQNSSERRLNDGLMQSMVQVLMEIIKTYVKLDSPDIPYTTSELKTYFAFIVKPEVKYDPEKKCYKDGFHILIPGIKICREVKRLIIRACTESEELIDLLRELDLHEDYVDKLIDKDSAHVPIFLLGSSSKYQTPPYNLASVKCVITNINKLSVPNKHCVTHTVDNMFDPNDKESSVVLVHELSLNWENSYRNTPLIEKRKYEVKEEFLSELEHFSKKVEETDDLEFGELSILNIHDPDTDYIKKLLNTLSSFRYTDFDPWFKVLCALAHTSKSYKTLAEEFSMKCIEKYSPSSFEQHWNSALENKKSKLGIGSLHFWAKLDNPIKYEEVRQHNIYEIVLKQIYDPQLEGALQHYDIAKILKKSLQYKYVYDATDGGTWYEFILEGDISKPGGIYKWREIRNARGPNSMKIYMSEVLPSLFAKITAKISSTIENTEDENKAKFHALVKNNVNAMARQLRNNAFKNGVMREAEQIFERVGFVESLNRDTDILGVGNGILKLGPHIQLVTGFHNYLVSKFTPVEYKEFNPYDPLTKKMLYTLRSLFIDEEPDAFEFLILFMASGLDFKKKEPILLCLVGGGSNGKSFLMELLRETMGEYGIKMDVSFLTARTKSADNASPSTMALEYARSIYYSEPKIGEELNMGKVKEFTGGEAMQSRKLYGDFRNIKPNGIHIAISNNEFDVVGDNSHGTWRRLKKIAFRIKRCSPNEPADPNNPLEKNRDPSISDWPSDPEAQSTFLSILCYYYEILQTKYDGQIENVPHPSVDKETEAWHDRQDKINRFINIRFVKTVDPDVITPMSTIVEKYTKWHDSLYPDDKSYKKNLSDTLVDSKLSKIITKDRLGVFIKGYRILDNNEEPEEGEEYLMDVLIDKKSKHKVPKSETTDEYYTRMCDDFEIRKRIKEEYLKKENAEAYKKKLAEQKEALEKEREISKHIEKKLNKSKTDTSSDNYSDSSFSDSEKSDNKSKQKSKYEFNQNSKQKSKYKSPTKTTAGKKSLVTASTKKPLVSKDLDEYNEAGFKINTIKNLTKSKIKSEEYMGDLNDFLSNDESSEVEESETESD